jgi:hypothetical protein
VAEVADFFIFHNGVFDSAALLDCPKNVKAVNLESTENFARHLLRVLDEKEDSELSFESRDRLIQLVAKHLYVYSYALVEFKPALGHIFAPYIEGYSHWGYSDLDMLFGDLGRWISPDEMKDFDIVTYGFGDQHRLYMRGQLTFHKNTPKINQLWRKCDYLSDIDVRLAGVLSRKQKYHFESAEGCYSAAVLDRKDIRVKYASKAWTDVHGKDTAYSHGVYLARDVRKNRHVIYKASSQEAGHVLNSLTNDWFNRDKIYSDRRKPLQHPVGSMEAIDNPSSNYTGKCMYWVQQKYQSSLCLAEATVGRNDTVYWVDGQLFKQTHRNIELETDVSTAPFFHFQEWKRYYRSSQLSPIHTSSPVSLFVLTKEGALPLTTPSQYNNLPSPLQLPMYHWSVVEGDRNILPGRTYCLISGRRQVPPQPPTSECFFVTSWRDKQQVEILSGAPLWTKLTVDADVTLVLTLQITKAQSNHRQALIDITDIAAQNLDRWQGQPAVVLLHVSGMNDQIMSFLQNRFGSESDLAYGTTNALIAVVYQDEDVVVSRKALMNMAIDAVPTRWYISGMELERGLILSPDSVFFTHRVLLTHGVQAGRLYIIPQFARDSGEHNLSLSELRTARSSDELQHPSAFDDPCDGDSVHRLENHEAFWWSQTELLLDTERGKSYNEVNAKETAASLTELEASTMKLLTDDRHMTMFALDDSPILLTDNLSPRNGLRGDELVRHTEELGGRRCYNGLRLAQFIALQYELDVLDGAFALSTKTTRGAARWGHDHNVLGLSRCDGCFMFGEDEHEDVLESIIKDEIVRPTKTAILWNSNK